MRWGLVAADLDLSTTQVQWVQEVYTLVFAALLMVWGTTSDRLGRRRVLAAGLVVFMVASVLCAFAPSGTWLIAARALQGVGGSMILPTTLALLNATFRGPERGIAFAVWGSTIGSMAAVGPVLGGWLTSSFSWHWAFWINVPFGIAVVVLLYASVRESRQHETDRFTDWLGAGASVLGFGLLVFALIEGRSYGWWTATDDAPLTLGQLSPIPLFFLAAAIVLALLVRWEKHRVEAGRSVLLDVTLFRIPTFANGNVTALTVSLGEFAPEDHPPPGSEERGRRERIQPDRPGRQLAPLLQRPRRTGNAGSAQSSRRGACERRRARRQQGRRGASGQDPARCPRSGAGRRSCGS